MAAASPYRLRVEGMDCASSALKIETAMQRLPGVSDVNVSYASETLALQLDEDRTALGTIEQKIRALGYTPVVEQAEPKASLPRKRITEAWWKGSKGRLVLLTGVLFVLAFALARILPDWEQWLYSGAALISVIPFAKRAVGRGHPRRLTRFLRHCSIGCGGDQSCPGTGCVSTRTRGTLVVAGALSACEASRAPDAGEPWTASGCIAMEGYPRQ